MEENPETCTAGPVVTFALHPWSLKTLPSHCHPANWHSASGRTPPVVQGGRVWPGVFLLMSPSFFASGKLVSSPMENKPQQENYTYIANRGTLHNAVFTLKTYNKDQKLRLNMIILVFKYRKMPNKNNTKTKIMGDRGDCVPESLPVADVSGQSHSRTWGAVFLSRTQMSRWHGAPSDNSVLPTSRGSDFT